MWVLFRNSFRGNCRGLGKVFRRLSFESILRCFVLWFSFIRDIRRGVGKGLVRGDFGKEGSCLV